MTYQVKEGDVLEYRGDGEWTSFHTLTVGKKYTTKKDAFGLYIVSDTGAHAIAAANFPKAYGFHLVTTPPATIQHEGYNYTRGEPVVPEWVKDGAWVVSKDDNAVVQIYVDERSIGAHNVNGTYHSTIEVSKADTYLRPFTNEDWKWGMWAEYKGEKVFVMSGKDGGGVFASRPKNTYFFALFSGLTPTTAP